MKGLKQASRTPSNRSKMLSPNDRRQSLLEEHLSITEFISAIQQTYGLKQNPQAEERRAESRRL